MRVSGALVEAGVHLPSFCCVHEIASMRVVAFEHALRLYCYDSISSVIVRQLSKKQMANISVPLKTKLETAPGSIVARAKAE